MPFHGIRQSQLFGWIRRACLLVSLLSLGIGGLIGLQNNTDVGNVPSAAVAAVETIPTSTEPQQPRYTSKAIQDLRPLADRVLANNPEIDGAAPPEYEHIDHDQLRVVTVHLDRNDGTRCEALIARTADWLAGMQRTMTNCGKNLRNLAVETH